MKVLIADDERPICFLIKELVEWDLLGLEFGGFAYSGEELYDKVQKLSPDIIITDINMPVLSGIDFIKRMRKEKNDTKVIIVTGYQDFEYAHSAIKYNVEDYLLKPIDKTELNNSLKRLKDEINQEKVDSQTNDLIINKLNRDELQRIILLKKEKWEDFNYFQILVLKTISNRAADFSRDKLSLIEKFIRIIETNFSECNLDYVLFQHENLLIFSVADKKHKDISLVIQRTYEELVQYTKIFSNIIISLIINEENYEFSQMTNDLINVNKLVAAELIVEEQIVDIQKLNHSQSPKEIKSYFSEIRDSIMKNDLEDIKESILYLKYINPLPFDIYTIYIEILNLYDFIFDEHHVLYQQFNETVDMHQLTERTLRHSADYDSFIDQICDDVVNCIRTINSYVQQKNSMPIEKAITYVYRNFSENISLAEVSELVNLTPTYFSTLFKEQYGLSFIEFLTAYRIDQAKSMLINSDKNIKEISYAIGFKDSKYFSKVFRKKVGIKPSEFRRMFS